MCEQLAVNLSGESEPQEVLVVRMSKMYERTQGKTYEISQVMRTAPVAPDADGDPGTAGI